jgi:hypothetical protein
MSAPLKTVILGGTGFLGQRICRYAAMHGSVLSLSRRAPATPPPTSTRFPIQHVPFDVNDYVQGQGENVQLRQEPSDELREHLKDCTVAVHALGTVMDSDAYKLIVKASSASEMLQNAQRLVSSASPTGSRGLYELLNRDGATVFALLCARFMPNLKHFVYVSTADQLLPVPFQCAIDRRYWTTKRHAETILTRDRLPGNISMTFQRSIVRPGASQQCNVYDHWQASCTPMAIQSPCLYLPYFRPCAP